MARLLVNSERHELDAILDQITEQIEGTRAELDKVLDEAQQRVTDARREIARAHRGWAPEAHLKIDMARSAVDDARELVERTRAALGEVAYEARYLDRYLYRIYKSVIGSADIDRRGKGIKPPKRRRSELAAELAAATDHTGDDESTAA